MTRSRRTNGGAVALACAALVVASCNGAPPPEHDEVAAEGLSCSDSSCAATTTIAAAPASCAIASLLDSARLGLDMTLPKISAVRCEERWASFDVVLRSARCVDDCPTAAHRTFWERQGQVWHLLYYQPVADCDDIWQVAPEFPARLCASE